MLETYGDEQASFAVIRNYVYQNINFATRDFFGNIHVNQSVISWSMSSDSKNYVCTITLQFSTIYAYCYFNDIYPNDEEDTSNKVTEDFAFFYKTTTTSKSPFYNLSSKQITADFLDYFGGNFALSNMTFSFCYSTYDTKMYSDATKTYMLTNGNVVHQWDYTAEQLAEENGGMYSTYTIKINPYVWYLSAIVISLLVALVLVIVVKVKEHNKKSKSIATDTGIVEAVTEDVTVTKANQTEDKE